jgi:hypothetical protein
MFGAVGVAGAGVGCSAAVHDKDLGETDQAVTSITKNNGFGAADFASKAAGGQIVTDPAQNAFFANIGANGRTCNSCHKLENGLGISTATISSLFTQSNGQDPIFRLNDGSNAPSGPWASILIAQNNLRALYGMLIDHGLIRVGIGVPAGLTAVFISDPYYFASPAELSLFRRPLPSVNVSANVLAMWDGRESDGGRTKIFDALVNQANDATRGHAQRPTDVPVAQRQQIAQFQLDLFNAQVRSNVVGDLRIAACTVNDDGDPCEEARGGAANALNLFLHGSPGGSQGGFDAFSPGINDPFRFNGAVCDQETVQPNNASCFKNVSMTFFDPWESDEIPQNSTLNVNRGELGDGENIFYTKPMFFTTAGGGTEVPGLSDVKPNLKQGTCTTCHNTPEFGSHSVARFFNTGVSDPFMGGPNNRDHNPLAGNLVGFPQYSIASSSNPGAYITTTDPGRALHTGKLSDLSKFKVPNLRGLGSRAPYFHNGSAKTLNDVVNFYNTKFGMHMTSEEIRKVVLFLQQT